MTCLGRHPFEKRFTRAIDREEDEKNKYVNKLMVDLTP